MQAVTGAISKEELATGRRASTTNRQACRAAHVGKDAHPCWLGADAGKFRGLDGQVHDAATAMGEAAQRNDGQAVIAAFSKSPAKLPSLPPELPSLVRGKILWKPLARDGYNLLTED